MDENREEPTPDQDISADVGNCWRWIAYDHRHLFPHVRASAQTRNEAHGKEKETEKNKVNLGLQFLILHSAGLGTAREVIFCKK